jgi:hypothetical protein
MRTLARGLRESPDGGGSAYTFLYAHNDGSVRPYLIGERTAEGLDVTVQIQAQEYITQPFQPTISPRPKADSSASELEA